MDPRPNTAKVGDEFARQYYNTLQNAPENLYKLYKDKSTISRPGLDGTMRVFTLSKDLKWRSPGSFDSVKITSVTSQDSLKQGILVVVYGYLTFNERPARHFTQVFFLVPQEKGYIVCTDMFRFVDIPEVNAAIPPANDVIEEKVPETEGAALRVSEPNHGFDNVPKLSCASEGAAICAKKLPLDATIAFVENAFKQFGEIRRGGVEVRINWSCDHSTDIKADAGADTGNGNSQDSQAITEDAHIRVKDLPPNATVALVESVFKQFGPIKKGRIRVINPANSNYWYAFVEFEEADAAKRAIQASPLNVDGHTTYVEQKQPYYEGEYVGVIS
ncbi:putative hydrolase [Arabidopsis thaliana]